MADFPQIRVKGLATYSNPLGDAPAGSLVVADNIVIDAEGTAQSRRGFATLTETFGNSGSRANKLFAFQNQLLVHYDTGTLAYRVPGTGWTNYSGSYPPPDNTTAKTRSAQANSNFYFTSSTGVQKLDLYTNPVASAGMVKGLDVQGTIVSNASGFLANSVTATISFTGNTSNGSNSITSIANTSGLFVGQYLSGTGIPAGSTITTIVTNTSITISNNASATNTGVSLTAYSGAQVAYRLVWGIKDANNNEIVGAPSQRTVIQNTGTTAANVTIQSTIPAGITTSHFYQLYRSAQYDVAVSGGAVITPNEELQLVYEANPTSTDITNKYISFTDVTPDSLRGATIYTADSQEGILQSNYPPPWCKDLAQYKNCVFYANAQSKFSINLTMLAVGGSSGAASGDIITIAGVAYTGGAATNTATGTFQVYTSGTPAQNIANTAQALVQVINNYASNTSVYAYYMSGVNDLPGKIYIESRTFGGASWAVTASAHGSAWTPVLPTSGTTVSSTQSIQKNAVYISKEEEPEAVPLVNVLFAGSAAYDILRIIPLRDSVFILKADGIFRLVGETPSDFYITLFDDTTQLLSPDSAVNLNNTIYCLSNQGVVSVSDTGVKVVSRAIEGDLLSIFGQSLTGVQNLSFGVSYQSDRKYILGIITNSGDTFPTQLYVYNLFTDAWTRWPLSKRCGLVNPADNLLYLGDGSTNTISQERKNYNRTDYVDGTTAVTIVSTSGTSITLSSVSGINVGDLLYQSAGVNSVITAVNAATNVLTVQDSLVWSNGSATVYASIKCTVQFQPQTATNFMPPYSPQFLKQFSEIELFFKKARFNSATVGFFSDLSQSTDSLSIAGVNNGAWGLFSWGSVYWGGDLKAVPIRTYVPAQKQRCSQLSVIFTHQVAYGDFQLDGFNMKVRPLSERTSK